MFGHDEDVWVEAVTEDIPQEYNKRESKEQRGVVVIRAFLVMFVYNIATVEDTPIKSYCYGFFHRTHVSVTCLKMGHSL